MKKRGLVLPIITVLVLIILFYPMGFGEVSEYCATRWGPAYDDGQCGNDSLFDIIIYPYFHELFISPENTTNEFVYPPLIL